MEYYKPMNLKELCVKMNQFPKEKQKEEKLKMKLRIEQLKEILKENEKKSRHFFELFWKSKNHKSQNEWIEKMIEYLNKKGGSEWYGVKEWKYNYIYSYFLIDFRLDTELIFTKEFSTKTIENELKAYKMESLLEEITLLKLFIMYLFINSMYIFYQSLENESLKTSLNVY